MKRILSLVPALFLACLMSVGSYAVADEPTIGPGSLGPAGDSVTFNLQAGEWKGGKEKFVGTYTVSRIDADHFVIDVDPYQSEDFKVELNNAKVWINDTGKFLSSPGNQKGNATAVELGEAFQFSGERLYIFIHFDATYWEQGDDSYWYYVGEDSVTGYDPEGRIEKGPWFMYNYIDILPYEEPDEPEYEWVAVGSGSGSGYDPNGRIAKGPWFMYNTVDVAAMSEGDMLDFDVREGEWKKGNTNFVGKVYLKKTGANTYVFDYENCQFDDMNKVEFEGFHFWVNSKAKFESSPGNQKKTGAYGVTPGVEFTYNGGVLYFFAHFDVVYYQLQPIVVDEPIWLE